MNSSSRFEKKRNRREKKKKELNVLDENDETSKKLKKRIFGRYNGTFSTKIELYLSILKEGDLSKAPSQGTTSKCPNPKFSKILRQQAA
ncbi:hypothetical protein HZH66_003439 [Vespula vulgaris]|uniref:Uncharacterized protein n=1 Tax=Vespula vulgaris TaxID=7454 RepID=A0A834KD50_VESVU|nr:hypothetical protein HZH66_003439 [Vespula vulgaris]